MEGEGRERERKRRGRKKDERGRTERGANHILTSKKEDNMDIYSWYCKAM